MTNAEVLTALITELRGIGVSPTVLNNNDRRVTMTDQTTAEVHHLEFIQRTLGETQIIDIDTGEVLAIYFAEDHDHSIAYMNASFCNSIRY